MANMNNLFEVLDASDSDDLDFSKISAQEVEVVDDSCSCCTSCC